MECHIHQFGMVAMIGGGGKEELSLGSHSLHGNVALPIQLQFSPREEFWPLETILGQADICFPCPRVSSSSHHGSTGTYASYIDDTSPCSPMKVDQALEGS